MRPVYSEGLVSRRDSGVGEWQPRGHSLCAILGRFKYKPSIGVSFIFEDAEGMWKLEVKGNNLWNLHRDLTLGRRESVHIGEAVTSIDITGWSAEARS